MYNSSEAIVAPAWGVKGVWVEGTTRLSATGFPKWTFVDGKVMAQNTHGAAVRRVPLETSDITEMVHFAALDTRLVGWCSRACRVLFYSLS